jgi:catechol 2,3-dioxygenase-like lactoylglutathione lyase family enzyme
MIRGIHHTAISTPDLDRSVRFYCDLLGFEVVQQMGWPRGIEAIDAILGLRESAARVAMLRRGDSLLELFEFSSPTPHASDPNRPVCDHGITHLCLLVDDVEREYARLCAAGMRFHAPPMSTPPTTFTYGRDPDGNVIELLQVSDPNHPFAARTA